MVNRRPKLTLLAPSASAEEAAAIVAALERFMRESVPRTAPGRDADPWRRAAILEGVSRDPRGATPHPWINT